MSVRIEFVCVPVDVLLYLPMSVRICSIGMYVGMDVCMYANVLMCICIYVSA